MWPFKEKKSIIEEQPIKIGSFYTFYHEDPFTSATVKILDVRKNRFNEWWVKYNRLGCLAGVDTMPQKTFLTMYIYISPPIED